LLRLNPGVEAHTHEYRQTGVIDSKFGLPTLDDQAERAVTLALAAPALDLRGYHAHVGSQIFELAPYRETIAALLRFAARMRDRHGFVPMELSPGGGLAIPYTEAEEHDEAALNDLARTIGDTVRQEARAHALPEPRLTVEPGRSIVGPAGVALYLQPGHAASGRLRARWPRPPDPPPRDTRRSAACRGATGRRG
jgi:diaminopimelate decarboxylase